MFYFIRHAETNFNIIRASLRQKYSDKYHFSPQWLSERYSLEHVDTQLSQTGRKQAQQCRQKMSKENIDLVLVSPLRRAMQTCDIIFRNHKDKPKIIVEPYLRQYFQATCDIGGRMIQSMKQFEYFDFSMISDPEVWYIHFILDEQAKNSMLSQLSGLNGQERHKKGIELSLQYLKLWHQKVIDDRQILASIYGPMKRQKDYIKKTYSQEGKNISIVSHSENFKVYFDRSFLNCEVMSITQQEF